MHCRGTCGLAHLWLTDTIERARRTEAGPTLDLCGVWTFAGVLLLFVVLYTFQWRFTGNTHARRPVHRVVYSVATLVLAAGAAGAVVSEVRFFSDGPLGPADSLAVLGALVVAWTVNTGLVGVVIWLTAGRARALGGWADNLVEIGQLVLGVFVAFGLVRRGVRGLLPGVDETQDNAAADRIRQRMEQPTSNRRRHDHRRHDPPSASPYTPTRRPLRWTPR